MVSMAKIVIKNFIDRRRGCDKIIQIHRRHGFGEIIQKIKILSATWFRRKTEEGSDAIESSMNDQT